jgi:hypothetical protein
MRRQRFAFAALLIAWSGQCACYDSRVDVGSDAAGTRRPTTCTLDDADCDGLDSDCDGKIDEDQHPHDDPVNCGQCGVGCRSGVCQAGSCERCGSPGEACCPYECDTGIRNQDELEATGFEPWIGGVNECRPSQPGGARPCGLIVAPGDCVDDVCRDCGLENQPCCSRDQGDLADGCYSDSDDYHILIGEVLQCFDGRCQKCGAEGQPCCDDDGVARCPNDTGFAGLACIDGTCQRSVRRSD